MPQMSEILAAPRDMITVKRVFGDPIERDGVTIVPVASVRGGGGGGYGPAEAEGVDAEEAATSAETGAGGGFGMSARPVGVYVIRGDAVEWQPAIDATRVSLAGIFLVGIFALVLRSIVNHH